MSLAPRASISIAFGGGHPVEVEYSLSPFGADDAPRELLIHRAESAGVDLLKQWAKPELDQLSEAIRRELGL